MQVNSESGRFRAWEAIREAWSRLEGARRTYLYMTLTVAIVGWLVGGLLLRWLPPGEPETVTLASGEVVRLVRAPGPRFGLGGGALSLRAGTSTGSPWVEAGVTAALTALFAGAFAAYALRRAVGLPVRYTMLADHMRFFPTFLLLEGLAIVALLVLRPLGPMAVLTAWVVGSMAFAFTDLIVVDRGAGVGEALRGSLRVVGANLGQTVLLLVTVSALSFLLNAPLLLSLRYLPPAVVAVLGLVAGLVAILLRALLSVALACAFRDAVGIRTAGGELPHGTEPAGAAASTRT